MDKEKLIDCVREHEHLFNPFDKDYRNQQMRMESWNAIGENMGVSGNECKDTWSKLRNAYTNAIKRRKTKNGQAAHNLIKWKFEDQMSFLQVNLQPQRTYGNSPSNSPYEEDYFDDHEADSESSLHILPDEDPTLITLQQTPPPNEIKSQRIKKGDSRINSQFFEVQESQNIIDSLDEIDMYFLCMSRSVKKLPPLEQVRVKMEVSESVFQAELRALQQTHSTIPSTSI